MHPVPRTIYCGGCSGWARQQKARHKAQPVAFQSIPYRAPSAPLGADQAPLHDFERRGADAADVAAREFEQVRGAALEQRRARVAAEVGVCVCDLPERVLCVEFCIDWTVLALLSNARAAAGLQLQGDTKQSNTASSRTRLE